MKKVMISISFKIAFDIYIFIYIYIYENVERRKRIGSSEDNSNRCNICQRLTLRF